MKLSSIMANKKCAQSPSTSSKKSQSSLSNTAIKVGRKAKQAAIKTVKSLTALIKKPQKPCPVISESEHKSFYS